METFKILKKSYYIENIYCSIDINNIENYLKRIELLEKELNNKKEFILVPDTLIFSKNQINWAIFVAKNRFLDKINISKKIFSESLMILSYTNQIKKVSKEFYLKEGIHNYFLNILSEKKISKKEVEKIKEKLNIKKEIKKHTPNLEKIKKFYKIKNIKEIENEILEKQATSFF